MANQKEITLREGDATPKDIVLYDLPVADVVTTTIYLYETDATPKDVVLRDPTAAPGGGSITLSAAQTLATLTQAANVAVAVAANAAQTLDAITHPSDVDVVVAASASQNLGGLSQSAVVAAIVGLSAAQTLGGLGQSATAAVIVVATASVLPTATIPPRPRRWTGPYDHRKRKRDLEIRAWDRLYGDLAA